jgi:Protein of unknown function (DUF2695)
VAQNNENNLQVRQPIRAKHKMTKKKIRHVRKPIEVMTTEHPRWIEFCEALAEAITEDRCYSECAGAREILVGYNVHIEDSVEYFNENGGFCDCEILMNVDPAFWGDDSEEDEEKNT